MFLQITRARSMNHTSFLPISCLHFLSIHRYRIINHLLTGNYRQLIAAYSSLSELLLTGGVLDRFIQFWIFFFFLFKFCWTAYELGRWRSTHSRKHPSGASIHGLAGLSLELRIAAHPGFPLLRWSHLPAHDAHDVPVQHILSAVLQQPPEGNHCHLINVYSFHLLMLIHFIY